MCVFYDICKTSGQDHALACFDVTGSDVVHFAGTPFTLNPNAEPFIPAVANHVSPIGQGDASRSARSMLISATIKQV